MIVVLGVSHRDGRQAARWLAWVAEIAAREPPGEPDLVVCKTWSGHARWVNRLRDAAGDLLVLDWLTIRDELECGYPKCASHLFVRSLEAVGRRHPERDILWVESDATPLRPGWRSAIAAEYAAARASGKWFLGVIERGHGHVHVPGVAVYPANWAERSPLLAGVLDAPDIWWGPGRGQAWDTYSAPEVVPQAAESRLIQQIWNPPLPLSGPWIRENIRPETVLFHPCKDGSLIDHARGTLK